MSCGIHSEIELSDRSGLGDMDVAELMRFLALISEVIGWCTVCIFKTTRHPQETLPPAV